MDENKIREEFVNILRAYVKDPELLDKVSDSTNILNDLKVNSARLVDIIIKCEDVFNVTIEDDEVGTIETIGDAVLLIERKLS